MLQIAVTFGCSKDNKEVNEPDLIDLQEAKLLHKIIKDAIGDSSKVSLAPVSKYYNPDFSNNNSYENKVYLNIGEPNDHDINLTIEGTYDGWWLDQSVDGSDNIKPFKENKLPDLDGAFMSEYTRWLPNNYKID